MFLPGPTEAVRPVRLWPYHFFHQATFFFPHWRSAKRQATGSPAASGPVEHECSQ